MEALRERFGKYHVLEKIAQGGMAEVYKVKTIGIAGFEKVQALKRILPSSAREGRFIRSFIDEARIAVELAHRNIVQVFDFGKADGELFLAMELIEGKDLRTAVANGVARESPPSTAVSAYIISEVAQGLDYAHRKTDVYGGSLNIVHCDVSPSNVMLSSDGYVKILDFGIARATFASALERRRLRGKPRYMAPEQTLGEPATPAADVFALGIIAWELFTGLPLYRGNDLKSILEAVRRTDAPRIDRINPNVPKEIVDGIAIALNREPSLRGTAADLATACVRTAMQAGARELAAWLETLETEADAPQPSDVASASVPAARATPVPPARPSRTASLANISAHQGPADGPRDFGEGTPGFARAETAQAASAPTAPARYAEAELQPEPIGPGPDITKTTPALFARHGLDADPGVGISARFRLQDVTSTAISPAPRPEATISMTNMARFGGEVQPWHEGGTLSGIARLAEALPPDAPAGVPPTEPFQRISFESIPALNRMPSFDDRDDEHTEHSVDEPHHVPDNTSYDDLAVPSESADIAVPAAVFEEPIDDDLLALASPNRGPIERRRTVVVAGVLAGASHEQLRPITQTLGELAYQRGGVVTHLDDDGLVVVFGLEVAGEDDVAVAMGWALDGSAMVSDAGGEVELVLRVGARAGVATTIDENGANTPQEAIDEARALAREAAPERPLFVGGAGRITSGLYALREVPAPRRIGRRSRVIEVVGTRGFIERDRQRDHQGKFVGRTVQLAELDVWMSRAVAANRRLVVMLQGAAGTGKSRLVAELISRRTSTGTPLRVITTSATPASRLAPFALVIDLYQAALGLPPARGRAARRQVVDRLLHLMSRSAVPSARARAVASDLDHAMELRDGVSVGAPEVADLRPRLSAGLAAFRAAMADRDRPLLTIIEDLHLADSASLEVLRHTLAVSAAGPELLVLTSRPESYTPPAVDALIYIGDLVGAELRALIADRLAEAATPFNIAAVLARGGGNPLFVEELAQAVRDAGPDGDDIPASARDVILARMERLSGGARAALRYAAVLGNSARIRMLEELLGDDEEAAQRAPKEDSERAVSSADLRASGELGNRDNEIEELIHGGFLVRAETSSSDGELAFARGLIRDVVYESLSARSQRDTHARVGRLLASRFFAGREEPPATIAEHLERGGETAGAAAFWLRAGRLALTASDADAAVACFSRTLLLERELGTSPPTATSRARRREALSGREEAHRLQGNLASDHGDLDELQRLCEGDHPRLADVSTRRAQRMQRLGDYANATIATVVAEDHAIAARDDRLRGEALRVRAEILERLGRFDEALGLIDVARELFHRQRALHDEMAAMIGRGRIHLLRAHYEAARDAYRPVLALIDKTGDPWLERIVTNHVAVIEMCLGNFTRAMESAQRSLELCRRYGDRGREGDGLSVTGIILLEVGLYEQAAAAFAEALDILSHTSSRWSRADCMIYAGVCELRRGRPAARMMIDEALGEARRIGARYLEANALIARAGANLARGDLSAAIADAHEGTTIAQTATLVGYEIQGLARHALALSRAGNHSAEAGTLVHRALDLLEHQQFIEGSEEDVRVACIEVLTVGGAHDRAELVRERARSSARRKLDALVDPAWRVAYASIPEISSLLGNPSARRSR